MLHRKHKIQVVKFIIWLKSVDWKIIEREKYWTFVILWSVRRKWCVGVCTKSSSVQIFRFCLFEEDNVVLVGGDDNGWWGWRGQNARWLLQTKFKLDLTKSIIKPWTVVGDIIEWVDWAEAWRLPRHVKAILSLSLVWFKVPVYLPIKTTPVFRLARGGGCCPLGWIVSRSVANLKNQVHTWTNSKK